MMKKTILLLVCALLLCTLCIPVSASVSHLPLENVELSFDFGEDVLFRLGEKILEKYQIDIGELGADYDIAGVFTSDGTPFSGFLFPPGDYRVIIDFCAESPEEIRQLPCHIRVGRADPEYVPPEPVPGLVYDGTVQRLITPGSTSHGTMEYSLDAMSFSEEIPVGANAGEYTVYYRIIGDEVHNNTPIASVRITIGKATLPEFSFGSVISGGSLTVIVGIVALTAGLLAGFLFGRKTGRSPAEPEKEDNE